MSMARHLRWCGKHVALMASLVGIVGCAQSRSQLRVVHAAPDAAAGGFQIDVYVTGKPGPILANLHYGEASGYAAVDAGKHAIELRPAGTAAKPVYCDGAKKRFGADDRYTIVVVGVPGAVDPASGLRLLDYRDSWGQIPEDKARIRFVHAWSDAPAVTIRIRGHGCATIDRLERFEASGEGGIKVPANQVLLVDVLAEDTKQLIATFTIGSLPSRTAWYGVLTGFSNAPAGSPHGLTLLTVGPIGTRPRPNIAAEPAVAGSAGAVPLAAQSTRQ